MKHIYPVIFAIALILSACNTQVETENKNELTKTEEKKDNNRNESNPENDEHNHDHNSISNENGKKPLTEQEAKKIFGEVKEIKPGTIKKYPVKGIVTKTISKIIKAKDNDTIIYSEDTGHGVPTIPAGEGHEFTAISEVNYKELKMYMLQDGRFITANPKHVEVVSSDDTSHFYPKFQMHKEDYKYLDTLNKKDPDYKAYEDYAIKFGSTQYDSKKELLMFTAIHQVNDKTEGSFVIEDTPFLSFEDFKKSK
ncbi:hypothetical protein [Macrococcus animalis]|uniref:hypothetical protein n=1 Tax=Macrococcus animalis TaxID=3395467 RepID=UPI0039BDDA02